MNLTPEGYVSRLLEISNRKYEFLKKMLELTKQQSEAITVEDMEVFQQSVAKRQDVISNIDQADEEFNVYYLRFKREMNVESLEEIKDSQLQGIKELQTCIRCIVSTINEIIEIDNANNRRAKELLNDLGSQIKTMNQGKMMNTAYRPGPVRPASYFIDKKK